MVTKAHQDRAGTRKVSQRHDHRAGATFGKREEPLEHGNSVASFVAAENDGLKETLRVLRNLTARLTRKCFRADWGSP
jgi:hypothetical protein